MSATAEIVIESAAESDSDSRARQFHCSKGKPAVYVQKGENFELRPIEVGKRNDSDMVVIKGLKAGEIVALENPIEAAKKAKKL